MAEKKNDMLAMLGLPLVVCAFFVVVVFLAFQWNSHASAPNVGSFYQNGTTPPANQKNNGATVYTNATYGFEIQYSGSSQLPSQVYSTSPVVMGTSGFSIQQLHTADGAFYDSTLTNKNNVCLIPAGSAENSQFFSFKDSETISGTVAYHYVNYPNPNARFCNTPDECFYYDIYRISHAGNCYEIIYQRQGSTTLPESISQMISSLQFTH